MENDNKLPEDWQEKLKQLKDQQKSIGQGLIPAPYYPQRTSPCPSCGHCPTCGRGHYQRPYSWGELEITWALNSFDPTFVR